MLGRDINYGENLECKSMKSYWDKKGAISYKVGYTKTIELTIKGGLQEIREV